MHSRKSTLSNSVDIERGGCVCRLLDIFGLLQCVALIHLRDQLLDERGFLLFVPAMEEDKHDADQSADASDQNVEEGDGGAAREANGRHDTVEDGLSERVVHEIEPDACSFAIALNANECHGEDIDVKRQAEPGERVEIIGSEHAQSPLQDQDAGHDQLNDLGEQVDVVDARVLHFVGKRGCSALWLRLSSAGVILRRNGSWLSSWLHYSFVVIENFNIIYFFYLL